jgi:histidyl-tRNA synthetase
MKPSLLKGTRDFLPREMLQREFIFDTIRKVFQTYGFQPIETPALERLSTLMGKYGEEGDQLLFKVLNNGDFLSKVDDEVWNSKDSDVVVEQIAKRGLRYDLTVPLARFVALHQNELAFPFKRYQIQPVWRADRPQKGRYQEFYQCDADVVGSDSLMYEMDFVRIYSKVFRELQLPVTIKINHRAVLSGMVAAIDASEQFESITVAIDKWDKIGSDGVRRELKKIGLSTTLVDQLLNLLQTKDLTALKEALPTEESRQGVDDLMAIFENVDNDPAGDILEFAPELARGLNYYTGCIFEVVARDGEMGSIGGGGRYADLTEVFGMKNMPGVGISFGAERIYDYMEERDLFPRSVTQKLHLLFCSFDDESLELAMDYASQLRERGYSIDVYPEAVKLGKQLKYADQVGAPFVALIGDNERNSDSITLKDMTTGDQRMIPFADVLVRLRKGHSFGAQIDG